MTMILKNDRTSMSCRISFEAYALFELPFLTASTGVRFCVTHNMATWTSVVDFLYKSLLTESGKVSLAKRVRYDLLLSGSLTFRAITHFVFIFVRYQILINYEVKHS